VDAMQVQKLINEIHRQEQRLQQITVSDGYLTRLNIEAELGDLYNKLMSWVEMNDVEEIRDGMVHVKKKIEI